MKRTITLMLGLALTATGCIELPIRMDAKPQPVVETKTPAPMALPPVAPEQVSEENAPKVLRSLREELDRAANERMQTGERQP
jgi:hypothetical protein